MRSRRFSFLAGWLAVGVLAVAGFAAFGASGPTTEEVRLEAAAASIGHAAGAYAGLGFVQLSASAGTLSVTVPEVEVTAEPENTETPTERTPTTSGTGWLSQVEVRALVSIYFEPADVNRAVRVAWCESRFDPKARDNRSGAIGLFKHLPKYWADRAAQAGFAGAEPIDPEASVAAAAWAVYNDGGWDIFTCQG